MERKIAYVAVVLGLAAFSPAPINDVHAKRPHHPEQSQAQLAQQQKFNGIVPIVGQVPPSLDEVGQPRSRHGGIAISHDGDDSMSVGTANADKVGQGNEAIAAATGRVEVEEKSGKYNLLFGILLAAAGFLGWKGIQYKLDKSLPVPEINPKLLKNLPQSKA